jgi:hypothetical protein
MPTTNNKVTMGIQRSQEVHLKSDLITATLNKAKPFNLSLGKKITKHTHQSPVRQIKTRGK